MILQSLAAYYDRLLEEGSVQPLGLQEKEILWVVELDAGGGFVRLRRTGDGKRGRRFVVPAEIKKSVNIAANLLWGNAEYALGVARAGATEAQSAKVPARHAAFIERVRELPEEVLADPGVAVVLRFLDVGERDSLEAAEGWDDLAAGGTNVSYRLAGDDADLICSRPAVRGAVVAEAHGGAAGSDDPWCLITGVRAVPARLHPSIKGVRGAQTSGASLVSFNLDPFESHGWKQGENAPVSAPAAHAYGAALNHLLAFDNDRRHLVEGETTFVFWAKEKTPMEDRFAHLLGGLAQDEEESDGTPVRQTLTAVRRGLRPHLDDETPFYVLGLGPNAARLAVRMWHEGTVAGIAGRVLAHFEDLDIDRLWRGGRAPGLWSLIAATARGQDLKLLSDSLRGRLAADTLDAVLTGRPYPATLLARSVQRCRAEQSVHPIRAALMKATLNRRTRYSDSSEREMTVSLDRDNANPGYLLGRLFAVLEGLQRDANPGVNTTIRDRYFGAASATPRSAFVQLMRLKNAHLKKLRRVKTGYAIRYEKLIEEITDRMHADDGFAAHLSLEDQGRFIVGYHHQNHDLYTKHEPESEE